MQTLTKARPRIVVARLYQSCKASVRFASRGRIVRGGVTTPQPELRPNPSPRSQLPFYFDTGYGLYAKRPSRPFPPPFFSMPSGSFSDPLSTHDRSRDRRPQVNGEMIRGITNGDDAVVTQENFIGASDGVGAWAQRERGHAALWSRLILHFLALETDKDAGGNPDPVANLQKAYDHTIKATSEPNEWHGTTTACAALLHHESENTPLLYVTNIGDSQIMVVRPTESQEKMVVYKSEGQWHWFDCPYQLGTNSEDTPSKDAKLDLVKIEVGDIVLAMSDGVPDNLWEHEVADKVVTSMREYDEKSLKEPPLNNMQYVAQQLVEAAKYIAEDPYAESPYMERAIEEGLPAEGGKLDDISVVAAICRKRNG